MKRLEVMNAAEFASLCGVSPPTITRWIGRGMPAKRAGRQGRHVVINPHEALPWVVHVIVGHCTVYHPRSEA